MQNYRFGEIVLLLFPFVEQQEVKRRPALVLLDTGDADILVSRITSQNVSTEYDVTPVEWKQAGLLLPSVIRLHKILFFRYVFFRSPNDLSKVRGRMMLVENSVGSMGLFV